MRLQQHDYVTRPALLRRAIDAQQGWIEEKLGVRVSEAVIFETSLNLSQIGLEKILGCAQAHTNTPRAVRRLRPLVKTAEIPSGWPPLLSIAKVPPPASDICSMLQSMEHPGNSRLEWEDCPECPLPSRASQRRGESSEHRDRQAGLHQSDHPAD
jgi:hypothetical protein